MLSEKQRNQLFDQYPTADCVGTYTQKNYFPIEDDLQAAAMVGQYRPIEVLKWWQIGKAVNVVWRFVQPIHTSIPGNN